MTYFIGILIGIAESLVISWLWKNRPWKKEIPAEEEHELLNEAVDVINDAHALVTAQFNDPRNVVCRECNNILPNHDRDCMALDIMHSSFKVLYKLGKLEAKR